MGIVRGSSGNVVGAGMVTAATGAAFASTVTAYVTIDGGTQAIGTVASGVCTNEGNGYYTYTPTASEVDGAVVAFTFVGTGAIPVTVSVYPESVTATPAPSTTVTGEAVTTAITLISDAFDLLNVFQPGESIPDTDAQFGLRTLNRMIGSWAQQSMTIPAQSREVFDLVADQASYTIGTDGDFDTPRPPNQQSLTAASLVYTTSDPTIEIPLGLLTDADYAALTPKGLMGTQPSLLYYNPTFTATFGTIHLWPIPDNATNDLALYLQRPLSTFANLTTTYAFPPGYSEALLYNLARRLAKPFGRPVDEDLMDMAVKSLAIIKRANVKFLSMANAFGGGGWYDFDSGQIM